FIGSHDRVSDLHKPKDTAPKLLDNREASIALEGYVLVTRRILGFRQPWQTPSKSIPASGVWRYSRSSSSSHWWHLHSPLPPWARGGLQCGFIRQSTGRPGHHQNETHHEEYDVNVRFRPSKLH